MSTGPKVVSNVLAFDVAYWDTQALHYEVRGARIRVCRVVYGDDAIAAQRLQQCLQGGTIGVFRCLTTSALLGQGAAICL